MSSFSLQKSTQISRSKLSILVNSSLIGVWRGLIGLPFEHPFDNIKTNMQAYQSNFKSTFNNIYKKNGIFGFYSGFIVNAFRIASKQLYRWPLQIGLFGYYSKLFDNRISRATLGIICGINMAIIEVAILCPFQRVKVWLMTASQNTKMRQFFHKFTLKALFDGVVPVFCKQSISWVTFLGATQFFKELAYKNSNKSRFQYQLSSLDVILVSTAVAVVNTFFVMPVDCIKTNFQKYHNTSITFNQVSYRHKFRNTLIQIYSKHGIRGFFRGWQIKMVQYTINSLFTVMIFEKILKQYEKNYINQFSQEI